MKIGILTFHMANNYGAVLQAYALKEAIGQLGENKDVNIVHYCSPNLKREYSLFYLGDGALSDKFKKLFIKLRGLDTLLIKNAKFSAFRRKHLAIRGHVICNYNRLSHYDVCIVGSDQVWNGEITDFDIAYFLPWKARKRISYAASIGNSKINEYEMSYLKQNINNINCISVREKSSVPILESLTDHKITQVLDPTLLVEPEFWKRFITCNKSITKQQYILVYMLTEDNVVIETALLASKLLSLPILYINNSKRQRSDGIRCARNVGPEEFVNLFYHSAYVVTNSFHGTAFSIIFQKDFITIPHKSRGVRMLDLLEQCGLSDRIVTIPESSAKIIGEKVDYNLVNKHLIKLREDSMSFLISALN